MGIIQLSNYYGNYWCNLIVGIIQLSNYNMFIMEIISNWCTLIVGNWNAVQNSGELYTQQHPQRWYSDCSRRNFGLRDMPGLAGLEVVCPSKAPGCDTFTWSCLSLHGGPNGVFQGRSSNFAPKKSAFRTSPASVPARLFDEQRMSNDQDQYKIYRTWIEWKNLFTMICI